MKLLLERIHAALVGAHFVIALKADSPMDHQQAIELKFAVAALKALIDQWPLGSDNYNPDVEWRYVSSNIDSAAHDILMSAFQLIPPSTEGDSI